MNAIAITEAVARRSPRPLRSERRPRVLLIEDDPAQLGLYALALEGTFDVLTATRGEAGLVLAARENPDAVVTDVLLPDCDGLDIGRRLLANRTTAAIPILVLTGDDAAYARAEHTRDFDEVLRKPCPADVLIAVIQRAIAVRAIC